MLVQLVFRGLVRIFDLPPLLDEVELLLLHLRVLLGERTPPALFLLEYNLV